MGCRWRLPRSALAACFDLDPSLVDRKLVALGAQASETDGLFAALGEQRVREWFSTEAFVSGDEAVDGDTAGWGTWRVAA